MPFSPRELSCLFKQGGIDGGGLENPMSAAVRELKEETGISSARIVAIVSLLLPQRPLFCLRNCMQPCTGYLFFNLTSCSVAQLDEWLDYDFPTDIRSGMTGSWVRYRGQTQKWCVIGSGRTCCSRLCWSPMRDSSSRLSYSDTKSRETRLLETFKAKKLALQVSDVLLRR